MYLTISALLSISHLVSTSPLHELAVGSAHRLHKRDWVLECRDDVAVPVEANNFDSLSDFCKGYPHGLGLQCSAQGHTEQRRPTTLLSRMYGSDVAHVCLNYCHCQNLAPEPPVRVNETLNSQLQQCSVSGDMSTDQDSHEQSGGQGGLPTSSNTCSGTGTSSQVYFDGCQCNEYWYGRPNNQDCQQAMLRLPDHGITRHRLREFLPMGDRPQQVGAEGHPVRTPIILTHGFCTIAVLLPEGPGTQNTIVVDTLELNNAAEDLRNRCVQYEGIGGKFHQADIGQRQDVHQLPGIVMFAPDSKWKDFLDLKYSCAVRAEGSAECKPVPKPRTRTKSGAYGVWKYMGTIGKQGWTPVPKGRKQACSGNCNDPTDCDINSDCLCAAPNRGIPLSSSWSHHSCMYVAGAAAAIAAASISPNGCRGRCLLQEDGTLDIGRPLNASNATVLSFDVSRDFANLTGGVSGLEPSVTISNGTVLGNTSDPSSAIDNDPSIATNTLTPELANGFPSGPDDGNLLGDNMPAPLTNSTPIVEIDGVPTISNETNGTQYGNTSTSSSEYVIFNDTSLDQVSPILYCPCNCTYVSAACCLSSIVFEDPSMKIPMDPPPADSSVCCDPNSGLWLSKPSGECETLASNFSATGFIGIGNVKWNKNASLPVGFPDHEDKNS